MKKQILILLAVFFSCSLLAQEKYQLMIQGRFDKPYKYDSTVTWYGLYSFSKGFEYGLDSLLADSLRKHIPSIDYYALLPVQLSYHVQKSDWDPSDTCSYHVYETNQNTYSHILIGTNEPMRSPGVYVEDYVPRRQFLSVIPGEYCGTCFYITGQFTKKKDETVRIKNQDICYREIYNDKVTVFSLRAALKKYRTPENTRIRINDGTYIMWFGELNEDGYDDLLIWSDSYFCLWMTEEYQETNGAKRMKFSKPVFLKTSPWYLHEF